MSNDFNHGLYGTGYRNSNEWALGDQIRRTNAEIAERQTKAQKSSSAVLPSVSAKPNYVRPKTKSLDEQETKDKSPTFGWVLFLTTAVLLMCFIADSIS